MANFRPYRPCHIPIIICTSVTRLYQDLGWGICCGEVNGPEEDIKSLTWLVMRKRGGGELQFIEVASVSVPLIQVFKYLTSPICMYLEAMHK